MHRIPLLMLFAPSVALALGADDTSFYGLTKQGKLIQVNFAGDPEAWTRNNFLYSSRSSLAFSYCWSNKINEINVSFSALH